MAFSRLFNDECEYDQYLKQSTSVLDHQLTCERFYHPQNCANTKKIPESMVKQGWNLYSSQRQYRPVDLVDLESDLLRNTFRLSSLCPSQKYQKGELLRFAPKNHINDLPPDVCTHIETNLKRYYPKGWKQPALNSYTCKY